MRSLFLALSAACTLLTGCGTMAGLPGAADVQIASLGDRQVAKVGFGAEGGTSPSLCRRANGQWALAYVGTNLGDRHLYVTTSSDGKAWSKPRKVANADLSDQAPFLVEDKDGTLHMFFSSNRSGKNWQLYHTHLQGADWQAPKAVEGYDGVQDLAVAYNAGRWALVAEVTGDGLVAAESTDGDNWNALEPPATSGYEPSLAIMKDGRAVVAYQRGNEIIARALESEGWGSEVQAAKGSDRLRSASLAWGDADGRLVYTERTASGYQLRCKRFALDLQFTDGEALSTASGESKTPAVASAANGKFALAWGMKNTSDQQGVLCTLRF